MIHKKEKLYDPVKTGVIYAISLILYFCVAYSFAQDYTTEFDGGIIIPDRSDETLYILNGGTSAAERDWGSTTSPKNMLWKMPLNNAKGVPSSEMSTYNDCWKGSTSINDVKRVIYKNKIHLVVVGNSGDGVAMFEFDSKKCIYWSKTTAGGPHGVEFIPVGSGYIAVANPSGSDYVEIYDISKGNNKGRISSIVHKGVHSVHWDGKQKCLWAWGSGQSALKNYSFNTSGSKPELKLIDEYPVSEDLFYVGAGHGGSPMIVKEGGKVARCLVLSGKGGIGKFDTESHKWTLLKQADPDGKGSWTGLYSNPKGVSHNDVTGEIIFTKNSLDQVWSLENGTRKMSGAELYKARWWQHSEFSYPDLAVSNKVSKSSFAKLQNYKISSKLVADQIKTSIQLKNNSRFSIALYTPKGQLVSKVESRELTAGSHNIYTPFSQSSAIYFMRVMVNGQANTLKLTAN